MPLGSAPVMRGLPAFLLSLAEAACLAAWYSIARAGLLVLAQGASLGEVNHMKNWS